MGRLVPFLAICGRWFINLFSTVSEAISWFALALLGKLGFSGVYLIRFLDLSLMREFKIFFSSHGLVFFNVCFAGM